MSDARRKTEPFDRLTRLCDAMTTAMEADPDHREGDKVIVFLNDSERSGIQLYGYDDDMEAMVDLFLHLQAVFQANGKDIKFVPLGRG